MRENVKYKTLFLIFIFFAQTFGQIDDGEKSGFLRYQNQPLATVLNDIQKQFDVSFIYSDNLIQNIVVSCDCGTADVKQTLSILLKEKPISFKFFDESTIVLFKKEISKTKNRPVITKKEEKPEQPANRKFNKVKLLTKSEPEYPRLAVQSGIEGKVTIAILVSESGDVIETQIAKSSGNKILDSAAADYSKNLKFEPAHKQGKPVRARIRMTYEFSLL